LRNLTSLPTKARKGRNALVPILRSGFPRKSTMRSLRKLCKKHGGAHTTHNTCGCRRFEKDRTEKSSFRTAKKGGKKNYPVSQNFAQLTKKIDKLEKALKKSGKKGKKCRYEDSDSDSE
jgi:hypothetical protein